MNGFTHEHEAFVRALMHGAASEHKTGYTAENAAIATQDHFGLTEDACAVLTLHGYGYRDGIKLALDADADVTVIDEFPEWTPAQLATYQRGLDVGRNERAPSEALLG